MVEKGSVCEYLNEATHLSFGIDIMAPHLGELIDKLVKVDVWKVNFEVLDVFDNLAKDVVIVELRRIWYWMVLQRHAVGCSIDSLHCLDGGNEEAVYHSVYKLRDQR